MSKIMFMILNDHVEYLNNEEYDHRRWYQELGLDPNLFDSVIRGFIVDGKIIFFKGFNHNYDEEVIRAAMKYAPSIRSFLNQDSLEVWCGILSQGGYDNRWEPIYHIKNDEINSYVERPKLEEKKEIPVVEKPTEPMIDFKNDVDNKDFIRVAIIYSIITIILTIFLKSVLIGMKVYSLSNFTDFLLLIIQIGLLVGTLIGYMRKLPYAKYLGVAAGIALCLTFHIFDIILGVCYALFNIDASIYLIAFQGVKILIGKLKKK